MGRPGDAPQGGPPDDHRARPLRRRPRAARHALHGGRPLHRGAREDRLDRRLGREGGARRPRRLHRRGPQPRVAAPDGVGPAGRRDQVARDVAARQGHRQVRRPGRSRSWSAATSTASVDAAEQVFVEYDPLPVVVDPEKALEAGSPLVHEDIGTNQTHEWTIGGGDMDAAWADADVVIERRIVNHRTAGAPIETRACVADFRGGQLTLHLTSQNPHLIRLFMAGELGISEDKHPRHRARRRRRLRRQDRALRRGGPRRRGPRASSAGRSSGPRRARST